MSRPLQAIIHLDALQHNLALARAAAPRSKIFAVIKADAYGHGAVRVAQHLQSSTDAFAVACIEEALELREAGIAHPILLLQGFFHPDELPLLAQQAIHCVVHSFAQLKQLQQVKLAQYVSVWLKIDTGMHRLGFMPEQVAEAYAQVQACPHATFRGFVTHFASADELDNPQTNEQVLCFEQTCRQMQGERSLANSAAILGWPISHADWVRPGIMLYGVSPYPGREGHQEQLRPAMELRSRLTCVHHYPAGVSIGYGATWRCPEAMPVGVVAVGYADGYPRHATAGTEVLVNGQVVPLVGRVSMDMITVDLRSQPQAQAGDPVCLWGPDLPIERLASRINTIAYELLTGVAPRVPRVYQGLVDTAPSN